MLVIDPDSRRSHWNLGKVEKTYLSVEKKVRSVQVKTKDGIYDRPIMKLRLLLSITGGELY